MVGKNILNFPNASNHVFISPTKSELNLLDAIAVEERLNIEHPDIVIHAAGKVGGIKANMADPENFLIENIEMGLNVIKAAKHSGIKKLINLGSSCMYPRDAVNPLKEESILKGELEPTNEGYALAKIVSAKLCKYISSNNPDYEYKTVIPCNLYGKYDNYDENNSHMIPGVIRKLSKATIDLKDNKKVSIWGDGKARREFMSATDFADFVYYAIDNFEQMPNFLNVGTGKDFSINEYYQEIADVVGYKGDFSYDLTKPVGMKQKLVDIGLLNQFGWSSKLSLHEGLMEAYSYYKDEYDGI